MSTHKTYGYYYNYCKLVYGPNSGATKRMLQVVQTLGESVEVENDPQTMNKILNDLHSPKPIKPEIFIGIVYHLNGYCAVKYHITNGPITFGPKSNFQDSAKAYARVWASEENLPTDDSVEWGYALGGKDAPIRKRG
jgi:hypothetical protein